MKVCGDFQEQFGAGVASWNKDLDIDHKIKARHLNLFFKKNKIKQSIIEQMFTKKNIVVRKSLLDLKRLIFIFF
jgi:basic membrane lipoprotein Med (substrate-binding protein (PBP1-ABC) superfamily)